MPRSATPPAAAPRATLRPAEPRDAAALAGLAGELGYPITAAEAEQRLAALGGGSDLVLVADAGGRLAGWIHVATSKGLLAEEHALIAALVVGAEWRGQGIGRALVERASTWAAARGHSRLRVRSQIVREGALRFYQRTGFSAVKQQMVLDRPIPHGADPA